MRRNNSAVYVSPDISLNARQLMAEAALHRASRLARDAPAR
jgi:hypothetical protein